MYTKKIKFILDPMTNVVSYVYIYYLLELQMYVFMPQ